MNHRSAVGLWIVALLVEFMYFYQLIHQVHDVDEVVFCVTLIAATLVVGAVLVRSAKK